MITLIKLTELTQLEQLTRLNDPNDPNDLIQKLREAQITMPGCMLCPANARR